MGGSPATRHVAVVTLNFWPEAIGIGQTVTEFARFLSGRGLDVRVCTAMPYYPEWRIWRDYRGELVRSEICDGVRIRRSWHFVRPHPTTFTRLLHELTLSICALPNLAATLWHAQRAFIVSPALSFAFTASLVARLLRVPITLVVKDVLPDAAIELGMMTNRFMIAMARWLARSLYKCAEEIHTLGEGMQARIAQVEEARSKIHIVVDTVDPKELAPVPSTANEFRRRFVTDGKFAVLHTGNMGKKQDLSLLLRTAHRLRTHERFHFYVFGDGAMKSAFLEQCREMELENVSNYPLQERSMLRHMLSGADAVLVSQLPAVSDVVFPSKLITALAAGSMVVVAAGLDSEPTRVVRENGLGLTVPASDDQALEHVLLSIAGGEVDAATYRRKARQYATEHFGRDAVYGPVAARLREAVADV